jgi:hypoxanthine-guanine phosphoribosyltransferase
LVFVSPPLVSRYTAQESSNKRTAHYQEEIACSGQEIERLVKEIALQIKKEVRSNIRLHSWRYQCLRHSAKLLSRELGIDLVQFVPVRNKTLIKPDMAALHADRPYIIMDDIYDAGDTYNKVADALKGLSYDFAFCMSRYKQNYSLFAKMLNHEKWVVFSWE